MNANTFCKYCHRIPSQCGCTNPVKEQDESFDRTASHMAGEYVSYQKEHFEDEPQAEELHEILQSNTELTDEEIDECSCFVDVELSQRYGSIESIDDIDWTITGLRAFARALLKKAQEKC